MNRTTEFLECLRCRVPGDKSVTSGSLLRRPKGGLDVKTDFMKDSCSIVTRVWTYWTGPVPNGKLGYKTGITNSTLKNQTARNEGNLSLKNARTGAQGEWKGLGGIPVAHMDEGSCSENRHPKTVFRYLWHVSLNLPPGWMNNKYVTIDQVKPSSSQLLEHFNAVIWILENQLMSVSVDMKKMQERRLEMKSLRWALLYTFRYHSLRPNYRSVNMPEITSRASQPIHTDDADVDDWTRELDPQEMMALESQNEHLLRTFQDDMDQVTTAMQSLQEIATMQSTLAHHLTAQQEIIETIHEDTVQSVDAMAKANKQLEKTKRLFGEARLWVFVFLVVASAVLLFLDYYGWHNFYNNKHDRLWYLECTLSNVYYGALIWLPPSTPSSGPWALQFVSSGPCSPPQASLRPFASYPDPKSVQRWYCWQY